MIPLPQAASLDDAGVRHDIAAALAAVDAAVRAIGAGAPGREELCRAISAEVDSVRRLLAPRRDGPAERLPLARELASVVTLAQAAGTEITLDVEPDLIAIGDPAGLHRVVRNLIDNARTHAPGSPISISAESVGRHIQLRVEDRGPGVAPEEHDAIFAPRHRGRYRRNRRAGDLAGRGLGLAVASDLAEYMGGRLWVENRPGGGASFVLTLPSAGRALQLVEGT